MSAAPPSRRAGLAELRHRLAGMDLALERMERAAKAADARAESATPGGLSGYDPAILSGIRRKPNPKADERRWAAYDRQAKSAGDLVKARDRRDELAARIAAAEKDAAAPRDLDSLAPGDIVRDSVGWHRVVRVNAKSVTVETGYSWTDRIPHERVIETRSKS